MGGVSEWDFGNHAQSSESLPVAKPFLMESVHIHSSQVDYFPFCIKK